MPFPESFCASPNHAISPVHQRRGVLIHHTVMTFSETIGHMLNPSSEVSYHAVIATTGERCRLVQDEHIAWHAGVSEFQGQPHCNRFLLGLAFEGDTYRSPLTSWQIQSALEWFALRWDNYGWTAEMVTDHRQVAPGRKDDLNPVEWTRFHEALSRWAAERKRKSATSNGGRAEEKE